MEAKRSKLIARGTDHQDERANVALAAHTGDKAARAKLDQINIAIGTHGSELASLDAAITAAKTKLADAQRAEASAEDREQADELRTEFKRFVQIASQMDEHLLAFSMAADQWKVTLDKIHQLGNPGPTDQQVLTFGALATDTTLMKLSWGREYRHVAPKDRRNFTELAKGWSAGAQQSIGARLGEKQTEAA